MSFAGLCMQVVFESPAVDALLQPTLAYFNLNWLPSSGVTPFLMALSFTVSVSSLIALKQIYTGKPHLPTLYCSTCWLVLFHQVVKITCYLPFV